MDRIYIVLFQVLRELYIVTGHPAEAVLQREMLLAVRSPMRRAASLLHIDLLLFLGSGRCEDDDEDENKG